MCRPARGDLKSVPRLSLPMRHAVGIYEAETPDDDEPPLLVQTVIDGELRKICRRIRTIRPKRPVRLPPFLVHLLFGPQES